MEVDFDDLEYDGIEGVTVHNGKPFNGVAFEQLPNGGQEKVMFISGLKNGFSWAWYPSGILESEESFLANSLHGVRRYWDQNGNLISETLYEYGIKTRELSFDKQGAPIMVFSIDETDQHFETLVLHRKRLLQNFGLI